MPVMNAIFIVSKPIMVNNVATPNNIHANHTYIFILVYFQTFNQPNRKVFLARIAVLWSFL
jgi:hypothetical protein